MASYVTIAKEKTARTSVSSKRTDTLGGRIVSYLRRLLPDTQAVQSSAFIDPTLSIEDYLRVSERRLLALINGSIQGICIHREMRILFANQSCAEILGYKSPEELLSRGSVEHLIAPEELPRLKSYNEARARGAEVPDHYDFEAIQKDGSRIFLEQKVSIVDWDGQPAVQSTIIDITERKRAQQQLQAAHANLEVQVEERTRELAEEIAERRLVEAALRESEERFREFAESSSDWLWETDTESRFTYISERSLDGLAVSAADMLGKTRYELAANHDRDGRCKAIDDAVRHRQPIRNVEYEIVNGNGEQRILRVSGRPRFSKDGEFLGYRGTSTDVTEEVKARQREAQVQERFLSAIETLPESFALFDAEDRLVIANRRYRRNLIAAGMLQPGMTFEEITRGEIMAGNIPAAVGREREWLEERLNRHRKAEGIFELHRNNGWYVVREHRTTDGYTLVLFQDVSDAKKAEQALVAARDELEQRVQERTGELEQEIAERRQAQADLQKINEELEQRVEERTQHLQNEIAERRQLEAQFVQAQKMEAVGQLAGGIAHDFNNLLTVVMANLSWLRELVATDDHVLRVIDLALEGTRQAGDLTQRMLVFSRRQPLNPETVTLGAVLEDLHPLILRALRESISFETSLAPGLWDLHVDTQQLGNCILNVAINARDAMPDGGFFSLKARNLTLRGREAKRRNVAEGEYVEVAMTDNGVGMSPDVLDRVFDPFFTTKEVGKGSGLGLSMVFGFAEQSGGTVDIESSVGEGTSVHLLLPRSQSDRKSPPQDSEEPKRVDIQGLKVLVAEDDELVRSVVVEYLKMAGIDVLQAENGESAIRVLEESGPVDLVVSDIIMPGMNGIDLAGTVRERWPDTRVVLMTGYSYDEFSRRGLDPESMLLLRKPFSKADLLSKIGEAISE